MDRNRQHGNTGKILASSVVIILIIGGILLWNAYSPSSSVAAAKIKALYEIANPGTMVEVVSLTEESGVYKALLKSTSAGGTTYKEAYVTKDGALLFESAIFVQNTTEQITKMKNFVDCLDGKKVRIYGVLNQTLSMAGATATSLQLQALGVYSGKLYVSCDGEFLQGCVQAGIQQVPSVVYNSTIHSGAKTVDWLQQTTGCTL